jgi:hypothetical protein
MTQDPNNVPPPGSMPPPPQQPMPGGAPMNYASPSGAPTYTGPEPDKDAKTFAMLAHLLGIIGFLGPLIIWLVKKDQSPFVDDQGKEALNFHLTMLIGYIIGFALSAFCIGFLVLPVVWIVSLIFSIMGAMKANTGVPYRYPFAIRMIK